MVRRREPRAAQANAGTRRMKARVAVVRAPWSVIDGTAVPSDSLIAVVGATRPQ